MDQPASTVIQPTHTFRLQLSPDTAADAKYATSSAEGTGSGYDSPLSYTLAAFYDGKPLHFPDGEVNRLDLAELAVPDADRGPSLVFGRYRDPSVARALRKTLWSGHLAEAARFLESELAKNDGYVRFQLQIDGPDGDVHDVPWEYLTLPGRSDQPLATDERTPFARRIDRRLRSFQPSDEQQLRMLVVFHSAVIEEPGAAGLDGTHVEHVVDSLSSLMEATDLRVTLLTGAAYGAGIKEGGLSAGDELGLPLDRVQVVPTSLEKHAGQLGQYHILQFVSADDYPLVVNALAKGLPDSSYAPPPPVERYGNLGWMLDKARRVPALLVLPSDFVRERQTRRLDRFVDQGAAAVLEMPEFDPKLTVQALEVFYDRLFEHGIADIALNQLRRSWIDNSRFPEQLPILWSAVDDGRLFKRSVLYADERGVGPETPEPLPEPTPRGSQPDQSHEQAPASREAGPTPGTTATPDEPSASPGTAPAKTLTKARRSARQPASVPSSDQTAGAPGRSSQAAIGQGSSMPAGDQARTQPARPVRTHGPGSGAGAAAAGGGGGDGGQPPIILVDLSRYEPPQDDHVMTIRVGAHTVTLHFDAKDGSPTDYSSPNRLADAAYQQQILQAVTDRKRYGNLLFDAIIHNDPGPGGQVALTTEKGFDAALTRTNRSLRIELELDPNNLPIHEDRGEFLRRGDHTPLALLERAPLYRRLAGARRSLLVTDDTHLKVLVAICNPSTEARAKYQVIADLPPLDVKLETEIATLALQRLKAAQLLSYDILPRHPEEIVTRQMLLDAIEQGGYHGVHLVCHGVFVGGNPPGDYYLAIEGEPGQLPFLAAGDFSQWIGVDQAKDKLRLVVLAACQSAVSSSGDALRGLGPRLVLDGQVPAVIAMQEKLPFSTSQLFMQSFYDDLARSGRVDMALAATRQTINSREDGAASAWGIPVLFLSSQDGKILDVDKQKASGLGPLVPDIRTYHQLGASQDPRLAALNQALVAEAQAIGATSVMGALQRTVRSALAGPPAALVTPQNRDLLTQRLKLGARVDARDLRAFVAAETGLVIADDAYRQIAAALNKGKHIILIGPPGTGKTTLAQAICQYAADQQRGLCTGATVATATADWTTFDTVGGYVPTAEQTLEFRAGSFLQAISAGEWLVIDEINRAEIDKAFGELFTVLSGQRVDTPHRVGPHPVRVLPPAKADPTRPASWIPAEARPGGYDYVVHPNWRIVGTMNVYDRSALYSLSLAFMRRFAFIDLDLPVQYVDLCRRWIREDGRIGKPADRAALLATFTVLLDRQSVLMRRRALGPAIVRDMIGHVGERYRTRGKESVQSLLVEAFLLYAAPQLDGLDPTAIQDIHRDLRALFGAAAQEKGLLKRIADLYPFVSFAS